MNIYTIGYTPKTAEQFFELIKKNNIKLLLDIRLNNKSQIAGFTKRENLPYFLWELCQCKYEHCLEFTPNEEMYNEKKISWERYTRDYIILIESRGTYKNFIDRFADYENICLLCSESTPDRYHRRLLAEMIIQNNPDTILTHL
jgi:uncharacterized protein (DUF488 family)